MSILARIIKKFNSSQIAFSLIEFMVALAIGLIMLGLLYGSITRTYKSVSSIEQAIDGHSAIALYLERFEKDVAGVFVPLQARSKPGKNKQKEKQDEKESLKEEPRKPELRSVFLLKGMKNGSGGELSFVTTSALSVYNKQANYLVRVTYKLEQAKTSNGSQKRLWSLVRYELNELDYDRSRSKLGKDVRGYEILGNIEKFNINCTASSTEGKVKNSPSSFENYSEWNSDSRKQEELLLLPNFVSCSGTILEGKKAISFEYTVPIFAYNSQLATEIRKEEHQVQDKDKQDDKQGDKQGEKSTSAKQSNLLASLLKTI